MRLLTQLASPMAPGTLRQSVHNVREFGAVGDGATDDTTAINAAVTAALTSGLPVYAPAATYLVGTGKTTGDIFTAIATRGVEVFGDGIGKTILQLPNNVALTGNLNVFRLTGMNQMVRDLSIWNGTGMSGASALFGVAIDAGCYYPTILRVECVGMYGGTTAGGAGIQTFQPWNQAGTPTTLGTAVTTAPVSQAVTPTSMTGIFPGRVLTVDAGGSLETIVVSSVTATTFTAWFALNHGTSAAVVGSSNGNQHALIEDCYIHDCYKACGIVINSGAAVIKNTRIVNVGSNSNQHGIYDQGGYSLIDGCTIIGVSGYSIHGHKAVANVDGAGDRYVNNLSIDPGTTHIVVDTLANTSNLEVSQVVSTTLGSTISSGTNLVTPGSMAGIAPGKQLSISGTTETVTVLATTATGFLATFANAHANTDTVTGLSNANAAATLTRYVTIANNTFKGRLNIKATRGITLTNLPSAAIIGNTFEDPCVAALNNNWIDAATTNNLLVEGNQFRPLNGFGAGYAVRTGTGALVRGNQFVGFSNVVMNVGASSLVEGNYVSSSAGKVLTFDNNCKIANNHFDITGTAQAFNTATCTGVQIHDNTLNGTGLLAQWSSVCGIAFYNNTIIGGGYIRYDSGAAALQFYNNEGLISFGGNAGLACTRAMGRLQYMPKAAVTFLNSGGQLLKIASGLVTLLTTSDTVFVGISLSATSGSATDYYCAGIAGTEFAGVLVDGAWTAGNIGIPSTTAAAKLHDSGLTTAPASGSYVLFLDSGGGVGAARVLIVKTL